MLNCEWLRGRERRRRLLPHCAGAKTLQRLINALLNEINLELRGNKASARRIKGEAGEGRASGRGLDTRRSSVQAPAVSAL